MLFVSRFLPYDRYWDKVFPVFEIYWERNHPILAGLRDVFYISVIVSILNIIVSSLLYSGGYMKKEKLGTVYWEKVATTIFFIIVSLALVLVISANII